MSETPSMSFGKRRPKSTRAQLRPSNPVALQYGRSVRQRDRLARLTVVGVSVLAIAAILHGAGPPFTYRLGQRPGREIRVNVPKFERRNLIETNTKRQIEAGKIAPSMVNDPAPLRDLSERLIDLVDAVPTTTRVEALPENLRESWKLNDAQLEVLKKATATSERRKELHSQIE